MRILVVEDDSRMAEYIRAGLTEHGHVADVIANGREALSWALQGDYDTLIVDRRLPGLDGVALVKALRTLGVHTPLIFLTALGSIEDRVEGLDAGGDDYVVKPFAFSELMARINALSRRPPVHLDNTQLRVADLEMDVLKRTVIRAQQLIELQPREFALLEVLMRNADRVVTRSMLLERVWDFNFDPKTSVVETHISRLRAKIDKPFHTPLLHTIRHLGYSLHAPR